VLRQLNTYRAYIPNITKVCFVHDDDWWDETTTGHENPNPEEWDDAKLDRAFEMRRFFGSQKISVTPFALLRQEQFGLGYYDVPAGRREAVLGQAWKLHEFPGWSLTFDVALPEEGIVGQSISGFRGAPPDEFWRFFRVGRKVPSAQKGYAILKGEIQIPCLIDVSHVPDLQGYPIEVVEAMHSRDLSVSLTLDDPGNIRRPMPLHPGVEGGANENRATA